MSSCCCNNTLCGLGLVRGEAEEREGRTYYGTCK